MQTQQVTHVPKKLLLPAIERGSKLQGRYSIYALCIYKCIYSRLLVSVSLVRFYRYRSCCWLIAILSASGKDTSFVIYLLTEFGLIDFLLRAKESEKERGDEERDRGNSEIVVAIEIEPNTQTQHAWPAWHNQTDPNRSNAIQCDAIRFDPTWAASSPSAASSSTAAAASSSTAAALNHPWCIMANSNWP